MNLLKKYLLYSLLLFFSACTSKISPLNEPISKNDYENFELTKKDKQNKDVSLILTFSGGGTRAASFSYGVLKELKNQNLLSEVDVISSVSGGSFTSAYYGLYGDEIFNDFENKFLKKPIQTTLINTFLNPFNWFDFSLSNRSDYIAEYYENEIFGKKTFSDIRKDAPKIIINATDISTGNPFSFTNENFRRICSNLDSYPIGRAVTASSAVPVLFSPITLQNYSNCNYYERNQNTTKVLSYNDVQYFDMSKYNDKENYKYLHLVDGGIADNLGIRSIFHIVIEHDNSFLKVLKEYGIPSNKRIALIVVNAADSLNPDIPINEVSPDLQTTMGAVSTIQLQRYNTDTLDLTHYYFETWKKEMEEEECNKSENCHEIEFYLIELNFKQLPKKEAKKFLLTQTSLELEANRVDEIIQAGQKLLKESKEFQRLLNDIKNK